METTFDCAIKGKAVNADDCATISLQASADDFHKCLKCTRGQAVAKTANWKTDAAIAQSTAQASASTAQAGAGQERPARTSWDIVSELTGCKSAGDLAKRIHFSKPAIRKCLVGLDAGKRPRSDNNILPRIAELVGMTLPELMERLTGMADHIPQPGEMVPPTMMTTDPADALITTEEAEELLDSAESFVPATSAEAPADSAASPPPPSGPVAPLPAAGPGGPAQAEPDQDGWEDYAPSWVRNKQPCATVCKDGDMSINATAQRMFSLDTVGQVRLRWNAERNQLGIVPCEASHPGKLKLQFSRSKTVCTLSTAGLIRRYGLAPVRNKPFPITSGPGGMLVITIDMMPEQGEEAA